MPISWSRFKRAQRGYAREFEPHLHAHSPFTYYFWSSFAHQIYFDLMTLMYPETGEVQRIKSENNAQDLSTENVKKLGLPYAELFSGKKIGDSWDIFFSTGKMGEFRKGLSRISQLLSFSVFCIFLITRIIERTWMLIWDALGSFFSKDQEISETQSLISGNQRSDGLILNDQGKPLLTEENYLVKEKYDAKKKVKVWKKHKSDISGRYLTVVTDSAPLVRYIKASFSVVLLLFVYFPLYGLSKLFDFTDQYAMPRAAVIFVVGATVSFLLLPMTIGIIASTIFGMFALYSLHEWFWERNHFPKKVMEVSQLLLPEQNAVNLVANAKLVMLRHEWVPQGMYAEYHQAVLYQSSTTRRSYLVERVSDIPSYKNIEGYRVSVTHLGALGYTRTTTILIGVPEDMASSIPHDLFVQGSIEERINVSYSSIGPKNTNRIKTSTLNHRISLEDSQKKVLLDANDYSRSRGSSLSGHDVYAEVNSAVRVAVKILNRPDGFRTADMGNGKHRIFVPMGEGRFSSEILQGDYVIKREGMQLWIGNESRAVNMIRDPDQFRYLAYSAPKDRTVRTKIENTYAGIPSLLPTITNNE